MKGTALIIAAHGAGDGSGANLRVGEWARQLQKTREWDEVREAFNLGVPRYCEVLDGLKSTRVLVIPALTSDGYFSRIVLPRELAKNRGFSEVRFECTPPLGTHQRISELVRSSVSAVMQRTGWNKEDTAVVIVGHGTARHPRSRDTTLEVAERLHKTGVAVRCSAAFLDQLPRVEEVPTLVKQPHVVVYPFLIGGGYHAEEDIAERIGARHRLGHSRPYLAPIGGKPYLFLPSLGEEPQIVQVLQDIANRHRERCTPASLENRT
jgi:sirohydrochlorin cobaltochelatase